MTNTEPAFSGYEPEERAMTDDVALLPDEIYADKLLHVGGYNYGTYKPNPFDGGVKYIRADRHPPEPVAVDVEALKKDLPDLMMATYHENKGWNDCIDYLASRNLLKGGV